MLNFVKRLEQEGRWSQIRAEVPAMLETAKGAELARLHLSLSTAYFRTASGAADLRASLAHARTGYTLAPAGGLMKAGALQRLSSLLVTLGQPQESKRFALAYLKVAGSFAELAPITPYVIRDLSHVAYQEHNFLQSAALRRKALALFCALGNREEVARTQLNLVWAYYRAGQTDKARAALPDIVPSGMCHLLDGAKAAVAAAYGDWNGAITYGKQAVDGARLAHDFADAAEVALILAQASQRLGVYADTLSFTIAAAQFAARQDWDAYALLALNQRAEGGEVPHAHAAASLGAGGLHLDSRFTTGCA